MNLLRVGGTMVYESDAFYALADEYGRLIWQDFGFANFDYATDTAFTASVQREAEQFLSRTRPSLGVQCCGSDADQQGAMLGLPLEDARRSRAGSSGSCRTCGRVRARV
jgi:beta-mannosidase